jgi:hypothetical protein
VLSGVSVTGSGANYTVTANTGSGNGTLGLNLVAGTPRAVDVAEVLEREQMVRSLVSGHIAGEVERVAV